eukprot:GILK01006475.1.p1 GENE.GILK01006475.1~~GILK01006475.1.p1  ORF type:complete len:430 (+),score=41.18 GILK01006475.1:114-1403(+)
MHVALTEWKYEAEPNEPLPAVKDHPEYAAPRLSLPALFWKFLSFGCRAFGGPMAQIAMLKQELVEQEKWVDIPQFNRTMAVYQMLPGPEATELCCYFGMLSHGRIGSLLSGLGFILPGFALMLLFSWIYQAFGLESQYFKASFQGIQPAVSAMVFRAVHKIGDHAVIDQHDKTFSTSLFLIVLLVALLTVANFNFLVCLLLGGVLYVFASQKRYISATLALLVTLGAYIPLAIFVGTPASISSQLGLARSKSDWTMFVDGLVGGLITFGGAYTAIPVLQQAAVTDGAWMTDQQFLDGIAICSIMPTPLVMFSTFVGYAGGGVVGAVCMTLGMFLPAFSFTLIGHNVFERITQNPNIVRFLDGVTAGVVGLIAVSAFLILKAVVILPVDAVLFCMSLAVLYKFEHMSTSVVLVFAAGIAGQALYVDQTMR